MRFYKPILPALVEAARDGIAEHAEAVLADSNRRAPVDERTLVASGFVSVADLTVQVGYKTPSRPGRTNRYPYIVRQHEDLEYAHDDGEAKFLEKAEEALRGELPATVARHVREALS